MIEAEIDRYLCMLDELDEMMAEGWNTNGQIHTDLEKSEDIIDAIKDQFTPEDDLPF